MKKTILLLALLFVLAACGTASPKPTATPDPFVTFTTVRNDCGVCGTDSPIGGWETADGRSLILSENGAFVAYFDDGTTMSGDWELRNQQLCLMADIGTETCFSYQQKVDSMKLDNGIYIRR